MTSATIQKINPNNCAHEQLFKAFGRVEAHIATTVTKDNIYASRKEGIKGNDQTDNRTSLCKPEDLFLALAQIDNKLARACLHKFDGEKKIPIDPIATLSEHHVSDNDNGYAMLDYFIFMDSFGAQNIAPKGTRIESLTAMPCRTTTATTTSLLMEMRKSSCALWIMMHAQSDSGGCGKHIVSGFINAEDNKATEQKTERTAPAFFPGLVHHPKMGAKSYTLLSVFESPLIAN
jgi:hypothetical protein